MMILEEILNLRDGAFTLLAYERLVDMRDHSSPSNGGLDQGIQLLISTDSKLEKKIVSCIQVQGDVQEHARYVL